MKKKVLKPLLAALLSFSMAFSGAGVSALATEVGQIESGGGQEEGLNEGDQKGVDLGQEDETGDASIELTEENTKIGGLEDKDYTGEELFQDDLEIYYKSAEATTDETADAGWYKLIEGTDYELTYEDNVNVSEEGASITVLGIGKYTGILLLNFMINAKDFSKTEISKVEDQVYSGSALEPEVTVKDGDEELTKDKDYTLSYENNTEIGTATVTVKGKGNYSGSQKISFKIVSSVQDGVGAVGDQLAYFTNGKIDTSKNGLVQDPLSKTWYYFTNGYVNSDYTNLVEYNKGWYYVKNGKIDWSCTTLAQVNNKGAWYYVQNGKLNWSYTGLAQNEAGWFYVQKGVVNFNYSGLVNHYGGWYYVEKGYLNWNYSNLVKYNGGWYYVKNGKIDWSCTTLAQVNNKGAWYYVQKGKLNWSYTGLAQNQYGWFYVQKGVVNFNYSGLVNHYGGWYYVEKGVLNWKYSNLVKYNGSWYYVKNGKIDWSLNTLAQVNNKGAWYYVKGGRIDWTYTGLSYYYGTWYYIEKGVLNWNYNSLVKYNGGWYAVTKGVVTFKQSGLISYNGGLYYVKGSKLDTSYNGLFNSSGTTWYYVKNGSVNYSYSGLVNHCGGWYYVEKGKVNWDYTSLTQYNGGWYGVIKGQVAWTYTGLLKYNNKAYYVNKGKVDWSYTGTATLYGSDKEYYVKNGVASVREMDTLAQKFSSDTSYLLMLDRGAHRLGIYTGSAGNWTCYAYWECVVGAPETQTLQPNEEFEIGDRGLYFETWTATQDARCWYWTQIWGKCYIHSQIYDRSDSPVNILDDTMDAAASHGCVRLTLARAKWIYDNIPSGTKVYIYN